jgi:6-phosphogluconolactonase (cycloisomerase 2 family)
VQTADPKVTSDGKFLAVSSVTGIGVGVVAMYKITSTGGVSVVSVSNAGADTGIDCDCASSHLYAGSGRVKLVNGMSVPNPAVDAYNIEPTGVLAPLAGSPFFAPGGLDVLLSPDGSKLFASGLSSGISVFEVASNGSLSVIPGSPFPAGLGTDSIAINKSGTFLYTADVTSHSIFALHISTLSRLPVRTTATACIQNAR